MTLESYNKDFAPVRFHCWAWNSGTSVGIGDFSKFANDLRHSPGVPRFLHGFKQPGYKRLIAELRNATTPMTATGFRLLDGTRNGYGRYRVRPFYPQQFRTSEVFFGGVEWYYVSPSADDPDPALYNIALGRFYHKAYEALTTFSGGAFAGQLRQTVRELRHPLSGIRKILENYDKGLRRYLASNGRYTKPSTTRRKLLDHAAETWLEAVFGWQPLVSDIDDLMSEIASRAYNSRYVVPIKGIAIKLYGDSRSRTFDNVLSSNQASGWDAANLLVSYGSIKKQFVRFRGDVTVDSGGISYQRLGFAPKDFLPTVWELVPWSFVIDYFSNISHVLESVAIRRPSIKNIRVTQRSTTTFIGVAAPVDSPSTVCLASSPSYLGVEFSKVVRSGADNAVGLPWVPDIDFDVRGSLKRLLNLSALFATSEGTRRRVTNL